MFVGNDSNVHVWSVKISNSLNYYLKIYKNLKITKSLPIIITRSIIL